MTTVELTMPLVERVVVEEYDPDDIESIDIEPDGHLKVTFRDDAGPADYQYVSEYRVV
jgi:hypothetical protein